MVIALFFGGASHEHEISLQSASFIFTALLEARHTALPIAVTKTGAWHMPDEQTQRSRACSRKPLSARSASMSKSARVWTMPANGLWHNLQSPRRLRVDCAFIMMHGAYGEGGTLQSILSAANIPYTGSDAHASFIAMDKHLTKQILASVNIPVVQSHRVCTADIEAFVPRMPFPLIVKPCDGGSSVGVYTARTLRELRKALRLSGAYCDTLLVEPLLENVREIEVAVTGATENPMCCEPGEVVIPDKGVYTYEKKYHDTARAIHCEIPAALTPATRKKLQQYARDAYSALGCSGMARVDFFITEDKHIYCNEVNTIPGCTPISLFPLATQKRGTSPVNLVNDLIKTALQKKHSDCQRPV